MHGSIRLYLYNTLARGFTHAKKKLLTEIGAEKKAEPLRSAWEGI